MAGHITLQELADRVRAVGLPFPLGALVRIVERAAERLGEGAAAPRPDEVRILPDGAVELASGAAAAEGTAARGLARVLWETAVGHDAPEDDVPRLAELRADAGVALTDLVARVISGEVTSVAELRSRLASAAREIPASEPEDVAALVATFSGAAAEPAAGMPATQPASDSWGPAWVEGGVIETVSGGTRRQLSLEAERVLVGRAEGCDFVIADPMVSAAHLELVPTEAGVVARDLGTTNGTWIGGVRIREVVLADATDLVLGESTLRFTSARAPSRIDAERRSSFEGLVGRSPKMRAIYAMLAKLAPTDLAVLVEGETGTGKERVARAIHAASPRRDEAFVVVDCGALPATLIESVLFGHEKGAFSGADARTTGLIESADGGTVLLDEIGELPVEMQTRLLRVVETRKVRRVGSSREIDVDVRFVSATHRDLPAMVAAGSFRSDLFFRLAALRLHMPPLRERLEDLPLLIDELARDLGDPPPRLSDDALDALRRRDFPGNVRELRHVLEVAAAFADGGVIRAIDLPSRPEGWPAQTARVRASRPSEALVPYREAKSAALAEFEQRYFTRLLEETDDNLTHAAARAGLERHHLRALLRARGLWPKKR